MLSALAVQYAALSPHLGAAVEVLLTILPAARRAAPVAAAPPSSQLRREQRASRRSNRTILYPGAHSHLTELLRPDRQRKAAANLRGWSGGDPHLPLGKGYAAPVSKGVKIALLPSTPARKRRVEDVDSFLGETGLELL